MGRFTRPQSRSSAVKAPEELRCRAASRQQVVNQQDYRDYKQEMDQAAPKMHRESEQPKNEQHCDDRPDDSTHSMLSQLRATCDPASVIVSRPDWGRHREMQGYGLIGIWSPSKTRPLALSCVPRAGRAAPRTKLSCHGQFIRAWESARRSRQFPRTKCFAC